MHPKITSYLNSVCRSLATKKLKEETRAELLSHIEEALEAKLAAGASLDQAVEETLSAMGEPRLLGRSLRSANRPYYLQWLFVAPTLGCLGIIMSFFFFDLAQKASTRISEDLNARIEKNYSKFLKDEEILSQVPIFNFVGRDRDAGPWLNPRVAWADSDNILAHHPSGPVDPKVGAHWKGADWINHANDPAVLSTDFTWMKKLKKYDHWELYRSGPAYEALIARDFNVSPWSTPLPDYSQLQVLIKLRLLRGIHDGALLPALKDVHELARLIYSTENLIASMVTYMTLQNERTAYAYGVAHGLIQSSDWQPLPEETLTRAKRALFAFAEFFDPWVDNEKLTRVFDGKTAKAGMCGALNERLGGMAYFKAYFADHRFLPDFGLKTKLELMDSVLKNATLHCRLSGFGTGMRGWANPAELSKWDAFEGASFSERLRNSYLPRVPIIGPWWMMSNTGVGMVDYISSRYAVNRLPAEE